MNTDGRMMNDEEKQPTITTVLSVVVVATIIMINIDFFLNGNYCLILWTYSYSTDSIV
jgi:hypothetical protein